MARLIRDTNITAFVHGCCLGADTEAVVHVRHHHPQAVVIARPGNIPRWHSPKALEMSTLKLRPKKCLDRNRDIVHDGEDLLISCPSGPEVLRSGTWSTTRYGRKLTRRIVIVWPDGTVTEEGVQ
jgi:hypothetical protein